MVEYTHTEYTDMVLVQGEAARNGRAARWMYRERYAHRVTPLHTLFAKVIQLLLEIGTFNINRTDYVAPTRRRTPNFEEDVLYRIEESPPTSNRTIARVMDVPHSTVWDVLRGQKLHPYHP